MIRVGPQEIRVLLVEDNEGDYVLTREMFDEHNRLPENAATLFRLARVNSFRGALEKLASDRFDVILLDLTLPDAPGVDIFYSVRAVAFDVPILVLSGNDDERTAMRAVQAGAQDYLTKGKLDSALLSRSIRHAVERNRIVQEFEQLKEDAIRANRLKSEFLFQIGFDVRTALHSLIATSELGLHSGVTKEQRAYFNKINNTAFSLTTTLNFLLDYARMELGQLDLNRALFTLRDLIGRIANLVEYQTVDRELVVVSHVDKEIPETVFGDPERLRQVIMAFADNAIHYSEAKGGMIIIAKLLERTDNEVTIHFATTVSGHGIPIEHQQLIFESFAQADASAVRKYGSNGLALAVSSRLINLMGGRVWLVSEVGRGTAFHFTGRFPVTVGIG